MPAHKLHMTTLEITHSRSAQDVNDILAAGPKPAFAQVADYTSEHRARIIKPMLSYDGAAIALSFVPAAGEVLTAGRSAENDYYTYHHLRRDIYQLNRDIGVEIESRYVVPSAHLTIGRFINTKDFIDDQRAQQAKTDIAKMIEWISKIEEINRWLQYKYWPQENADSIPDGGEWIVGEEKGLDCRFGQLWYGDGKTLHLGKGS